MCFGSHGSQARRTAAHQDVWIEFDGLDCKVRSVGDEPDPFIRCERKGRSGARLETSVKQDSPDHPWWGESFKIPHMSQTVATYSCSVMDSDFAFDDSVGQPTELVVDLDPSTCCGFEHSVAFEGVCADGSSATLTYGVLGYKPASRGVQDAKDQQYEDWLRSQR